MVCCIKQLLEDPTSYVHDFVVAPGKMLSGRGNLLVYLNNMIFRVTEGKLTPHILIHCMLLFCDESCKDAGPKAPLCASLLF